MRSRAVAVSSREATVRSMTASCGGCEVKGAALGGGGVVEGGGRQRCGQRRPRAVAVWSKEASGGGGVVEGGRATTTMEQLGDRGE